MSRQSMRGHTLDAHKRDQNVPVCGFARARRGFYIRTWSVLHLTATWGGLREEVRASQNVKSLPIGGSSFDISSLWIYTEQPRRIRHTKQKSIISELRTWTIQIAS
ncbi:predicted protein [Coccidioides posadasii str. Silveira]|uniref:Predicted protein n=2 Tax=Coccidioides posadasii TaxID=199306 RepID=E9CVM9_COCPS|nr:predicted protein [Coccidioides posadasii str. Silveira]KMM64823.1 hypothetical protein CPAG_01175 [Coccidioides posadasii RMSCC 3488]